MQNYDKIIQKGVSEVIVRSELEEKLKSGKTLKVKLGIDPSGADLHLGHMVVIRKLQEFQELGHEIQFLFGNFTGQIGDPTDKTTTRQIKTQSELEENAKKYLSQIGKVIDTKKITTHWNADWLSKLNFSDIIKLASAFSAQQMLERDMFEKRIAANRPIFLHEFMYPLMQGYDSVALKSDVEIGGTDQTFNLLAGRTIQKHYGMIPQNVLTVPLLIGTDGTQKMGKSLNNYVAVHDSPNEMFGKIMSIPDHLIIPYFELTTSIDHTQIKALKQAMQQGENPRDLKIRLAKEIIKIYHTEKEASEAENEFINIFSKKQLPTEIEEITTNEEEMPILDLLIMTKISTSKGEARRLISGGGVKINNEKIENIEDKINLKEEILLQAGKRKFLKIKFQSNS